ERRRAGTAQPLKELGNDPVSGKPITVRQGRFGLYVTDGETNASLRKGDSLENLNDERAHELLAERRERGDTPRQAAKKAKAAKAKAKKEAAGAAQDGAESAGKPKGKAKASKAASSKAAPKAEPSKAKAKAAPKAPKTAKASAKKAAKKGSNGQTKANAQVEPE
ncbi:MAG TPA: topoisomerase C-terminal repeat-containing protein, partial [Polyangiaceae bacterium]|nr:topoisomerase C-terminal repeat-containing protein [Polyangiaceae bacterium]